MMYKSNVFDLIDKARYNLKQSEKEIKKLAERKYGLHLVADEPHTVARILQWGVENRNVVDYQDLLWFPSQFGYFSKVFKPDIIMLDEAQDASIAQQDLIKRCMQRNTRLFGFGDVRQTINAWCGSDSESFEHLKDADEFHRPAVELPLTTCYRCPKRVIEYAKQFVDNDIHPTENAIDGEVKYNASLFEAVDGDLILCRNIAPLMDVYRWGVANGEKMYFRGEELGNNLIKAVDCADGETIPEIITSLKSRLISTWDFLTRELKADEKETMSDPRVLSLLDTIKTMESLPSTVETRRDLEKFTKDVFSNEGMEGIQLSTIHRAKGLEADHVFIVCPSLIPSSLATLDWQVQEEKNLQYVMCTRPKYSLNFVSEKEIRPYAAFLEKNLLYSTLNDIRDEVNEIKWV
jgi:superfamily I DNA/RNA helicase